MRHRHRRFERRSSFQTRTVGGEVGIGLSPIKFGEADGEVAERCADRDIAMTEAVTDGKRAIVGTGANERCKVAIQTNNVEVDDRGYIYAADRANTGLHILELTGAARKVANLP